MTRSTNPTARSALRHGHSPVEDNVESLKERLSSVLVFTLVPLALETLSQHLPVAAHRLGPLRTRRSDGCRLAAASSPRKMPSRCIFSLALAVPLTSLSRTAPSAFILRRSRLQGQRGREPSQRRFRA
jgi:hypothetical protein